MIVKLLMSIMLVIFIRVQIIGAAACLGISVAFAAVSFYARPFFDDSADLMDICARFAGILSLVLALISMPGIVNAPGALSGIIIAVNAINMFFMFCLFFYSIPWLKNKIKEFRATFELDDTCQNYSSSDVDRVIKGWSLELELRHRQVLLCATLAKLPAQHAFFPGACGILSSSF